MRIERYVKGLRECPDKYVEVDGEPLPLLTAEFGIYDNFPVILQIENYNLWIKNLKENFNHLGQIESHNAERFTYYENPAVFYTLPGAETAIALGLGTSESDGDKEIEGGIKKYNASLIINTPYRWDPQNSEDLRRKKFLESHRSIANLVIDLSHFLRDNKIPFTFLRSMGWSHAEDYSRIVVYNPKTKRTEHLSPQT